MIFPGGSHRCTAIRAGRRISPNRINAPMGRSSMARVNDDIGESYTAHGNDG